MERYIMKIVEVKKKDGSKVYRASVYLGVDQVTGKKVKTSITGMDFFSQLPDDIEQQIEGQADIKDWN